MVHDLLKVQVFLLKEGFLHIRIRVICSTNGIRLHKLCNIQLVIFDILICVDSKSVQYTLQNWICKVKKDIVYEVN